MFLPLAAIGQGTVLWNESVQGPLGERYVVATPLGSMQFGTNTVLGVSVLEPLITGGHLVRGDYFTFTVPAGCESRASMCRWIRQTGGLGLA